MIVVMDATVLLPLLRPNSPIVSDPSTGQPVERVPERLALLVDRLEKANAQIVVPTPALSEVLVHAGNETSLILSRLEKESVFRVASFGPLAAVEVAATTKAALEAGDKRGGQTGDWAWIKYDRQIVAIAVVERASEIFSDDPHVKAFGEDRGLRVVGLHELPLPVPNPQGDLDLTAAVNGEVPDEEDVSGDA